jgi:AcrR family transcriptional regulator
MPRTIPKGRFEEVIAAATQVFIAQGFRRTQMADIARAAGVAKGTLYLYVESKETLFDLALRHADREEPLGLPESPPLPTPDPAATLRSIENRITEEADLPQLRVALERRRVADVQAELQAIVRELYQAANRNRVAIKLVDRCAHDYPELAAVWFQQGRAAQMALVQEYLDRRSRSGQLRSIPDKAVAARLFLETIAFWAVHRYWDPSPQDIDPQVAEDTVVQFLAGGLLREK